MTVNGRWARWYCEPARTTDRFMLPVTYHRAIRGRTRQLSVSPKLLRRVLRSAP